MTVEADIFTALSPLVGARVYPDEAPEGVARPYITYQQVGGRSFVYVEGTLPDIKNGRIQFNVWADTRLAANALALQVESALLAIPSLQVEPLGAHVNTRESAVDSYGTMQDFSITSPR